MEKGRLFWNMRMCSSLQKLAKFERQVLNGNGKKKATFRIWKEDYKKTNVFEKV